MMLLMNTLERDNYMMLIMNTSQLQNIVTYLPMPMFFTSCDRVSTKMDSVPMQ